MITVSAGVFTLSFGMLLVLDAYRLLNNPLFPFQSAEIKSSIWSQYGLGLFGTFAGLAFMIKGFIDYHKYEK